MNKLIKGSKKAKEFMAKIRAKKKKVSGVKESTKLKKELAKKKIRLPHGYTTVKRVRKISGVHKDTKSHNVRISVVSGIKLDFAKELLTYVKVLEEKTKGLHIAKMNIKHKINVIENRELVKITNTQIKSLKKHILSLKKHI
jgi:hypothetical protein